MERWFSPAWRAAHPEGMRGWRLMLERMPREGYADACEAIGAADLTDATAGLSLPVTCVAGAEDVATPPEVVARLAALIAGARFVTLAGAGHLPPIEAPAALAGVIAAMRARLDGAP
jgi:pimeloyl-ACP methyl ester carboxylesterase